MNPISQEGAWHVGYWIGVPLFAILTLIAIGVVVWGIITLRRSSSYDRDDGWVLTIGGAVFALIFGGIGALCAFPFDASFHKYYRVEGKVQAVSDRLVRAGKGMQQRFVLVIEGQPFAVDDTRAALVKPGQNVVLQCSRDYQYAGDSGWVCEWGQQR